MITVQLIMYPRSWPGCVDFFLGKVTHSEISRYCSYF